MLQRCPPEEKENIGNEILKICRSLYETKHMLPVKVSFYFGYHVYESCFKVPAASRIAILDQVWRANREAENWVQSVLRRDDYGR